MAHLTYKAYQGTIEPQLEDNMLFGQVLFINDLVTYEAKDLSSLKQEFEASVDDYLAFCNENGKEPNKPFKGTFNVRIPPQLHQKAVLASADTSLNAFVRDAIAEKVERQSH